MTRLPKTGVAPLVRELFGAVPAGHPWNGSVLRCSGVHESAVGFGGWGGAGGGVGALVSLLGGVAGDFGAAAVVPPALLSLWANPCPVKYHASRSTTSPAAIAIVAIRSFVCKFPLLSNLWGNRSPCTSTAHPD